MATEVYEIEISKACPRCGSKKVLVAVFHLGATHTPRCAKCGLTDNKGDHKDLAESIITNCYYNYKK